MPCAMPCVRPNMPHDMPPSRRIRASMPKGIPGVRFAMPPVIPLYLSMPSSIRGVRSCMPHNMPPSERVRPNVPKGIPGVRPNMHCDMLWPCYQHLSKTGASARAVTDGPGGISGPLALGREDRKGIIEALRRGVSSKKTVPHQRQCSNGLRHAGSPQGRPSNPGAVRRARNGKRLTSPTPGMPTLVKPSGAACGDRRSPGVELSTGWAEERRGSVMVT